MQARVAAGVPTGGQFAQSTRGEAGVALTTATKVKPSDVARVVRMLADDVDEAAIREQVGDHLFDAMDPKVLADKVEAELDRRAEAIVAQQWDPEGFAAEQAEAELRQTIEDSYASANHWARAKGVTERSRGVMDVDDLAQEGRLAILERQANGQVVNDPKAYGHTIIWGKANQAANTAVRQENRKALKLFNAECERQIAELDRPLTRAEEDQIATAIRENWHDQTRKPSADFRRFMGQMETSLNAFDSPEQADAFLTHAEMGVPGGASGLNDVVPDSYTDRALDAIEAERPGDLRDARRMLWNALAESNDTTPMVQPGTLSQRKVTASRADMAAHGKTPEFVKRAQESGMDEKEIEAAALTFGFATALNQAEDGETNAATEALFAPWGTTDPAVRQAVVDQMRRYPDYAEAMWDSALKLANNRNADK